MDSATSVDVEFAKLVVDVLRTTGLETRVTDKYPARGDHLIAEYGRYYQQLYRLLSLQESAAASALSAAS